MSRFEYGIGYPFGFGWAAKGFAADPKPFVPATLHVQPYLSEPDTRSGKKAEQLKGTLTASELTAGAAYAIYRWDSVQEALTYSDTYKVLTFTATGSVFVFSDAKTFISSGTTYYRVVQL